MRLASLQLKKIYKNLYSILQILIKVIKNNLNLFHTRYLINW